MSDKRTTKEVKEQAKTDLEAGKTRIKEAARDATDHGKERLAAQTEHAATGVEHLADAVDTAASRLSELEHQGLADYASQLASYLGDMSGKLREKNVDELARDVRVIAQRNPALFLLGSVAVGLGLSRFAKATHRTKSVDERAGDEDWRAEDEWHGYENGEFISDVARSEGPATDRTMTPDRTGGSGL